MATLKWCGKIFLFSRLLFLCGFFNQAAASHLIAVEIRAKPLNCNTRTYEVTVIGYINYESNVSFGGDSDSLSFGDGHSILVPEIAHVIIDSQLHIGRVEYTVLHTYLTDGTFKLSYKEHSRNEGIINMEGSGLTTFYTESSITIASGSCDSSPYLTVPPIDRACKGEAYYHNPGAVDLDDDSLSFSFVTPQSGLAREVKNYLYPNASKFYSDVGINFNQANETRDGPPIFIIDPSDGTVTWNAPGPPGEYAFAIKVTAWKFNSNNNTWFEAGFSIRDMQVFVEDCFNKKPDLTIPEDLCVIAGTLVQFTAPASDPDGDPVVIEAFSDVFALPESPAEINPANLPQSTKAPHDTASIQFKWTTACSHVKAQPYKIVFKITDTPPAGPRLVRFKTISIKVIAPPPEFESVSVNPINKKITLQWKDSPCENIQGIQVWRRVDEYQYAQPECNSGMPYFLRYQLLATLPADSKTYTDNDLSFGAKYCYRIIALIGENEIASRLSLDTCLIPKPAEAPVITHVSVFETSEANGSIRIQWTSPFDIDKNQYPPPYTYKIYRSSGMNNSLQFDELNEMPIADTVYMDTQLDSQHLPYQYKVELFVPGLTTAPIDTSSSASSVFLKVQPLPGSIKLTWQANTPWYNYIQRYPYHRIYRSEEGPAGQFILIDSVNVNEDGFQYVDSGTFQGRKLAEEQVYYYKILTRGAYGNPAILEPLENLSQIAGTATLDITPPCTPVVALENTDCSSLSCTTDTYYNKLTWSFPSDACFEEGLSYKVFVAESEADEFIALATLSQSTFEHTNLSSLAKCYAVATIDAAGNLSALSAPVCNDNCPYFELPNVFTPGAEDDANDHFIAFGSENGTNHCARFVKKVDLKVYDRWGNEIYSINTDSPDNYFIYWNGLTPSGKEIDPGIYFYSAQVTFDMRDPSKQNKVIKGWVHLIR